MAWIFCVIKVFGSLKCTCKDHPLPFHYLIVHDPYSFVLDIKTTSVINIINPLKARVWKEGKTYFDVQK
jgi:hypothetical protein